MYGPAGLRSFRLIAMIVLVALGACEDDLNQPEISDCDISLDVGLVDVPATVRFLADVDGAAVLSSLTYTTPDGEVTVTELESECAVGGDAVDFCQDVVFPEVIAASISAEGEAGAGGQIGIGYNVLTDAANSDTRVCSG